MGKELFIRFTARFFRYYLSIYVYAPFPFDFEGGMLWDLIVLVPDHCIFFLFMSLRRIISEINGKHLY